MPMETRSSSALFKRAEQLRRWQESETNQELSIVPCDKPRRIKFSDGCVFLAACAAGDKDEVERLLAAGADINTANVDGLTALHQACIDDNLDMVEFLVEHGCDLNRGDNEGWTPLHATASCGFVSIARYLLESGADVAAVNNDGDLPIDILESQQIEQLLRVEINRLGINCESVRGQEEVQMLEDATQWLNARCVTERLHPKTGASSLHVASAKGYIKVMSLLIQAGADLNCQDYDGWTPLHAGSHWGQKEACQILADNLANMDIKNFSGQTCFDVCDPDMIKLLDELKKKQASMQRERPEIEAILQRPCKAPPPLKRRTSVTRMSGADKSSQVIKDTILERAQIEANLRLEEEEEEDKGVRNDELPRVVGLQTKEAADEVRPRPGAGHRTEGGLPSTRQERLPEEKVSWRKTVDIPEAAVHELSTGTEAAPEPSRVETATEENAIPVGRKIKLKTEREEIEEVSDESSSPTDETAEAKRSFVPPTRDEESEAQRKIHAKRVRETRRSTQGVTLEDLKSAEQQLLRKQQEEDERRERERESGLGKRLPEPSVPGRPVSTPATTDHPAPKAAEKRISWRSKSEENPNVKEEQVEAKEEPVVLRRPAETNHLVSNSELGGRQSAIVTCPSPLRTRQRPISAPAADTSDCKSLPASNLLHRIRIKSEPQPQLEGGEAEELDNEEGGTSQPGSQAAAQRRRRPKRRSTGVVFIDGEGKPSTKVEAGDEYQGNDKVEEDKQSVNSASDRHRNNRYGSQNTPGASDGGGTPSRLSDQSQTASPVGSTTSLNEEADRDYKKLYFEMKEENERLKKKFAKSESELEVARQDLQRAQRNMRNSLNDGDKRERRGLERKISELEEELKSLAKLKAENVKLKAENRALTRKVSNLSK